MERLAPQPKTVKEISANDQKAFIDTVDLLIPDKIGRMNQRTAVYRLRNTRITLSAPNWMTHHPSTKTTMTTTRLLGQSPDGHIFAGYTSITLSNDGDQHVKMIRIYTKQGKMVYEYDRQQVIEDAKQQDPILKKSLEENLHDNDPFFVSIEDMDRYMRILHELKQSEPIPNHKRTTVAATKK